MIPDNPSPKRQYKKMTKHAFHREDVEITHVKGSGPGGQNRNKRQTGVRLLHRPTGITIWSTERRSQLQNLEAGMERLARKVAQHYYRPPKRVKTKATRGSKERRLQAKKRDGSKKSDRRRSFNGE